MKNNELAGTAYSYIRFSSREQERGDSIRRQTEARDQWLARHPGVRHATDNVYSDLGVSAFRDTPTKLRALLSHVESGKIKTGSFLIVESLDRLTREELGDAFEMVLGLVNRGIRIVQLSPVETILQKPVNMTTLMLAVVELSRGNSESQIKSERIGAAWEKKRAACRTSGTVVTRRAKAWLELHNGKFVFKPGARALIRRVFQMATAGHGCRSIVKTLQAEKVPYWTDGEWGVMYVRTLLRGREVRGELRLSTRRPEGGRNIDPEPVVGYYPEAVTEAEWQAAQAALKARVNKGGRPRSRLRDDEGFINLFGGLLYDDTGDRLHVFMNRGQRVLKRSRWHERGESGHAFHLVAFERAVLAQLAEIDPRDMLDAEDGPDEVAELTAQLARIDAQMKTTAALVDAVGDEEIPELAAKLKAKAAERKTTAEALDLAKMRAASPVSAAWGECKGLVEALTKAKNPKEARVRLRQVIARTVESVTCVITPLGKTKTMLAAVRMQFIGGRHRDYLLSYRPRHVGRSRVERPAVCRAASLPELDAPGQIDLRNPADAAAFLMWLDTGDKNKALQKKGQTPAQVLARLEAMAPIPLG